MSQLSIDQAIHIAMEHHRAGQLPQAEQIYRQILAQTPNHVDALHLLGLIAASCGRHDAAIELIGRAVALNPDFAVGYGNLANSLRETGQLDRAVIAYRRAIALKPDYPEALGNLGVTLQALGRFAEAIASYQAAIALNPNLPIVHYNHGNALKDVGRLDEAIIAWRTAATLNPSFTEAHSNMGNALERLRRLNESIAASRAAIKSNPNFADAYINLANALQAAGNHDESITACHAALARRPDWAEAYNNLGNALKGKGLFEEAIAAYQKAISLKPAYPQAHWNLALMLLLRGDFIFGWEEHEWRWKCDDFPSPRRNFPQPLWDGRPLADATLLLHAEQGFGDTIQFIRYLPMVAERCSNILIECQAEVFRLVKTIAGDHAVIVQGQTLPPFDWHCPLLSLPRVFKSDEATIPRQAPYVQPDASLVQRWGERLAHDGTMLKVGLVWAGSKVHSDDRNRSMPFAGLSPLLQLQGIRFYSLQKSRPANQCELPATSTPGSLASDNPDRRRSLRYSEEPDFPPSDPALRSTSEIGVAVLTQSLVDFTPELNDFSDTAAFIANLDLVISVDTAVAHLAGAMGKPVWLMLPFVPDWRWMLHREDTPWYPTMRLFRQSAPGDWEGVIRHIAETLVELAAARVVRVEVK